MKIRFYIASLLLLLVAFPLAVIAESATAQVDANRAAVKAYGNIPLSFEPAELSGHYVSRSGKYSLYLGASETSIAVTDSNAGTARIMRFGFDHANAKAQLEELEPLPGVTNYYLGRDPGKWRLGVHNFAKLRARSVYPGVDVVYYGDHRRLEFDFVIAPQADPKSIAMTFSGMDKLSTADGDLVAELNGRSIRFAKPFAYQRVAGEKKPVSVEYVLADAGKVRLKTGAYDKILELVIDPVISYATYLGGASGDFANGMVVNGLGEAFITGKTCSNDFFTVNPNSSGTTFKGSCDAFVTKLSADGSAVLFTTFIAGQIPEPIDATASGNGIALDNAGHVYVAGTTNFRDIRRLSTSRVAYVCLGALGVISVISRKT